MTSEVVDVHGRDDAATDADDEILTSDHARSERFEFGILRLEGRGADVERIADGVGSGVTVAEADVATIEQPLERSHSSCETTGGLHLKVDAMASHDAPPLI